MLRLNAHFAALNTASLQRLHERRRDALVVWFHHEGMVHVYWQSRRQEEGHGDVAVRFSGGSPPTNAHTGVGVCIRIYTTPL